jgi:hypothetical protein
MHLVAAGCFILFAWLHAAVNRTPRRLVVPAVVSGSSAAAFLLWMLLGDTGVGSPAAIPWADALRSSRGLGFIAQALRMRWYDSPTKLNYIAWTALGPFRFPILAGMAAVFGAAIWVIRRSKPPAAPMSETLRAARRSALAFAVASWFMPWGLYAPSEITFLDFRMFTVAFAMLLATVSPRWFAARRARAALAIGCAIGFAQFGFRAAAFAREARPALELIREARPLAPMLSLVYHSKSDHFGKLFRLTHFLPMYYTASEGGINAQFWARYTDHLPIGYRPGKKFHSAPDWFPSRFQPDQLAGFGHVLMQAATDEDASEIREASTRAREQLETHAERVRCEGIWCLYRVREGH